MAAKLAHLVYRMLRYGMKYVDKGMEFHQTLRCWICRRRCLVEG